MQSYDQFRASSIPRSATYVASSPAPPRGLGTRLLQGRRTRSGRSGYGLTTFFLCSEKYLQVVRVQCALRTYSTAAYGQPQFQAFPASDVNSVLIVDSLSLVHALKAQLELLRTRFSVFFSLKDGPECSRIHLRTSQINGGACAQTALTYGLTTEKQLPPPLY